MTSRYQGVVPIYREKDQFKEAGTSWSQHSYRRVQPQVYQELAGRQIMVNYHGQTAKNAQKQK